MCLKSPVRRRIKSCGSESTFNSQIIFLCLNIICYCFQSFKIVNLINGRNNSSISCNIIIQKFLIINQTVSLD